ncbi:hypothetical protein AACH10_02855 [Ideonella sp. DXS22W]|uniref:Lipoprotein n=1 Tax=Pseudaquabacterium inlustre TaxID=2984192 RepID=A0ABU9CBC2_9BURK
MKFITYLTVLLAVSALSGCGTYLAKTRYQEEMLSLCARDGAPQVYKTVTLPSRYFENGIAKVERNPPDSPRNLAVAGRYIHVDREEYLKAEPEHRIALRMLEWSYVDSLTGETLGRQKTYCRDGGDTLSPNNTVDCCPQTSKLLLKTIFKQE